MTEQEMRFVVGALIDLMEPALQDGEDIDGEVALQTLDAVGLTRVHPEEGLVLTEFASQCLTEFRKEVLNRTAGP
jgi:hypothetical protein